MPTPSGVEASRAAPSSGLESNRSTPHFGQDLLGSEVVLPSIVNKSDSLDKSKPLPTSLQRDFLPDDLLLALSQAPRENLGPPHRHRNTNTSNVTTRHRADNVWNHAKRRQAYQHLVDDTPCLCGAGRDISFLYDVPKPRPESPLNLRDPSARRVQDEKSKSDTKGLAIPDSILPDEYHLVKNKGVQGLQYVEEPDTTYPKDHDKHLVMFPSLKPTSRAEVVQLKRALDDMLTRAGLDLEETCEGPTQMHTLLELIKKEQDIYNVVFHELIRQVSVDCIERGQLLAELRKRYSDLLNRVPRQIKELHEEVVAQRALDRRLTEELLRFKGKISVLTKELAVVKEHDQHVTRQAKHAQDELRVSMNEALKNASLLGEYHQLYELQRQRLEKSNQGTLEEKEMWSEASYCLALKVTEEHDVSSARRLHTMERSWAKLGNHFTIVLTDNDTEMLTKLQSHVDRWRSMVTEVNSSLRHREELMKDRLSNVQTDVRKWIKEFDTNILAIDQAEAQKIKSPKTKDGHFIRAPDAATVQKLFTEMKRWSEVLSAELEGYGGDQLLAGQEQIFNLNYEISNWTEIAQQIFKRHPADPDTTNHMARVNRELQALSEQLKVRMTGENGAIVGAINMNNSIESWEQRMSSAAPLSEAEWLRLYSAMDDWVSQLDEAVGLIGNTQNETERDRKMAHREIAVVDCMRMSQQWLQSLTNTIDAKDAKLSEDVTSLHRRMVQWMIKALLRRVPNPEDHSAEAQQAVLLASAAEHELAEEAGLIATDLHNFTGYLAHSCEALLLAEIQTRTERHEDCSRQEQNLSELEMLQHEALEWRVTVQQMLNEMGLDIVFPETEGGDEEDEEPSGSDPRKSFAMQGAPRMSLGMGRVQGRSISAEPGPAETVDEEGDVVGELRSAEQGVQGQIPGAPGQSTTEEAGTVPSEDVATQQSAVKGILEEAQHVPLPDDTVEVLGLDQNTHVTSVAELYSALGAFANVSDAGRQTGLDAPDPARSYEALQALNLLQVTLSQTEERAQHAESQLDQSQLQLSKAQEEIRKLQRQLQEYEDGAPHRMTSDTSLKLTPGHSTLGERPAAAEPAVPPMAEVAAAVPEEVPVPGEKLPEAPPPPYEEMKPADAENEVFETTTSKESPRQGKDKPDGKGKEGSMHGDKKARKLSRSSKGSATSSSKKKSIAPSHHQS